MRAVGIRADGWRSTVPAPARPWQASRLPELGDGAGRKGIDGFLGLWGFERRGVVWCGREGVLGGVVGVEEKEPSGVEKEPSRGRWEW